MAHLSSLGRTLLRSSGWSKQAGEEADYRLIVSREMRLRITRLKPQDISLPVVPASITPNMMLRDGGEAEVNKVMVFADVLSSLSWDSWQHILKNEPEWKCMYPLTERYDYGPFAVLMVVLGLNDYQLQGRAEHAYWPPIRKILDQAHTPSDPEGFISVLQPFYQEERLSNDKVRRLQRFLRSPLARMLWVNTPEDTARVFRHIWRELAKTMGQDPQAKTITFAMKFWGGSWASKKPKSSRLSRSPLISCCTSPQKACTPDNAACEGLFGRIKNEMFYNRSWAGVSIDGFMDMLDEYLHWYNEKRIKMSLGAMSPIEYRNSLGMAV